MSRAGWVLVGGRSTRMGRDKALLPYGGQALVERVASAVAEAAGSVTLVGSPERYQAFGYPVIPDNHTGCGPIGGIEAALSASAADWNLVLACDMPRVRARFLQHLLQDAESCGGDCLVPVSPAGRLEPLCAVYGRNCLPVLRESIARGVCKMAAALAGVRLVRLPIPEADWFENVNTPEEWDAHLQSLPAEDRS